jgi:hypothetical protein
MSRASRKLQVGAEVVTDFTRRGLTRHTITERLAPATSQSGVLFKVMPIVPGTTGDWIDADWFEPFGAQVSPSTLNTDGGSNEVS